MGEGGRPWSVASVAVAAALVLVVAAGCSGGSSSTATTLSGHDAFIHDASAVCRQMKDQADALNQTAATLNDQTQFSALLDQNVAILQTALTQLKTLTPDAADAAEVAAYLADLEDLHTQTDALVKTMQAGDPAASATAQTRQQQAQKKANDDAAALGLGDCVIT